MVIFKIVSGFCLVKNKLYIKGVMVSGSIVVVIKLLVVVGEIEK